MVNLSNAKPIVNDIPNEIRAHVLADLVDAHHGRSFLNDEIYSRFLAVAEDVLKTRPNISDEAWMRIALPLLHRWAFADGRCTGKMRRWIERSNCGYCRMRLLINSA
jgi:hypothetical protein